MTVLGPAALASLDRSFAEDWNAFCGCGAPAEVYGVAPSRTTAEPAYYCRACWRAR